MTKLLLVEVEHLMEEVSSFVQSCCNSQSFDEEEVHEDHVNVIDISERLSQGVLYLPADVVGGGTSKISKLRVNDINVIPTMYKESLFGPLQKKETDIMDVEQSMINTVFQEDIDGMRNIFFPIFLKIRKVKVEIK